MSLHQSRVSKDCISCRGLAVYRKVAQQKPVGALEGPRNLMKARQCDNRIAQAAQTEDQHALDLIRIFGKLRRTHGHDDQFYSFSYLHSLDSDNVVKKMSRISEYPRYHELDRALRLFPEAPADAWRRTYLTTRKAPTSGSISMTVKTCDPA